MNPNPLFQGVGMGLMKDYRHAHLTERRKRGLLIAVVTFAAAGESQPLLRTREVERVQVVARSCGHPEFPYFAAPGFNDRDGIELHCFHSCPAKSGSTAEGRITSRYCN